MFGIEDPWVALALTLCLASSLACVVYSWRNWNHGEDQVRAEDVRWAEKEDNQAP